MKVAVIGAGISGLSIAQLLKDRCDVIVYEKAHRVGGLIKCDIVDGSLFHLTGGHVFNTKRVDVMDMFWRFFDREKYFTKALRNSVISMDNDLIVNYPIEDHVYQLDDTVLHSFIRDVLNLQESKAVPPTDFKDFLIKQFGRTLYDLYFGPYNTKIWRCDLSDVPLDWLEGKLPMPSPQEMVYNNIRKVEERKFVHSSFYYPKSGGSQFLADTMAEGLDVRRACDIQSIKLVDGKWMVDGEVFDRVIYTGNVKALPQLIGQSVSLGEFAAAIDALKSHGTTAVFCEIDRNPYTWIYLPSHLYEAHRIICTGNFSPNNNNSDRLTATIEFTDEISRERILENLKRIPFSPKYIAHHYEPYTYPIQNKDTKRMIHDLEAYLAPMGLYLLGRFAQWEYYNMDVAMGAAIDLATNF